MRATLAALLGVAMLIPLAACGATSGASASSVPAVRAASSGQLPTEIVNGDFEYPGADVLDTQGRNFAYISTSDGSYWLRGDKANTRRKLPAGFSDSSFAWRSDQDGSKTADGAEATGDVQVFLVGDGANHYGELAAAQKGTAIYQDVATTPGVMYKWSLKHASLYSSYLDRMSVMIGDPGHETAQEATRTTVNGHGDQTGPVGTVIGTKVSNGPADSDGIVRHEGQWETYEGVYVATSTVTRFTFRNVDSKNAYDGNLLDDVMFTRAYPLAYDGNGAQSGNTPQQTK